MVNRAAGRPALPWRVIPWRTRQTRAGGRADLPEHRDLPALTAHTGPVASVRIPVADRLRCLDRAYRSTHISSSRPLLVRRQKPLGEALFVLLGGVQKSPPAPGHPEGARVEQREQPSASRLSFTAGPKAREGTREAPYPLLRGPIRPTPTGGEDDEETEPDRPSQECSAWP